MATPESTHEDREMSYPCQCGGDITLLDGVWACDKCGKEYRKEVNTASQILLGSEE